MNRLIRAGLMFGNLFHVSSPALVERYNRALKHLTGKTTDLTDFHIDISGYSPEIGDELDDHLYLNHQGVNRQFILLSMEQRSCPLLHTKFSTSRGILQQFMEENEAQLFALTARDAVAGELVNSVYDVSRPERLFDYRRVTIDADTTGGTVRDAKTLGEMVERFKTEPDGWFDDVLIARMIDLAGRTGDVVRNPVRLKHMVFDQRNFWTAHFGGLYVFQEMDHPAVIAPFGKGRVGRPADQIRLRCRQPESDRQVFRIQRSGGTHRQGTRHRRGRDPAARRWISSWSMPVADQGVDLGGATRRDMRRLARLPR